jgi:hypothetical protein
MLMLMLMLLMLMPPLPTPLEARAASAALELAAPLELLGPVRGGAACAPRHKKMMARFELMQLYSCLPRPRQENGAFRHFSCCPRRRCLVARQPTSPSSSAMKSVEH